MIHTTTEEHVLLYERLCRDSRTLRAALAAVARRVPDGPAASARWGDLARLLHGVRRITARMPGAPRLPLRPGRTASNADALVLLARAEDALAAYCAFYEDVEEVWDGEVQDTVSYWRTAV